MGISLAKGQGISLAKVAPALKRLRVGLGWKARATVGADFDLDASAILLAENGLVRSDNDFCFQHPEQRSVAGGAVKFIGEDNKTGADTKTAPAGVRLDDEMIDIELDLVPEAIKRIIFPVTIFQYEKRGQTFGQVSDAFIRLLNLDTEEEIAIFELSEDASTETAMLFGELYRHIESGNPVWKFRALGSGYAGGLLDIAVNYGIHITTDEYNRPVDIDKLRRERGLA